MEVILPPVNDLIGTKQMREVFLPVQTGGQATSGVCLAFIIVTVFDFIHITSIIQEVDNIDLCIEILRHAVLGYSVQ